MGDRANIEMKEEGQPSIFFYTHWAGTELPQTLQDALKRGADRWDDSPYLGRIIFCELVKDAINQDTGYGISPYICDGENRVLEVDSSKQTVTHKDKVWTFKEFIDEDLQASLAELW